MEVSGSLAPAALDAHFDRLRANLIRCEECNENFFFDFLRHPRYFVTHFKACHLKNVLYRFNGCSEEENQRVRFGPRRKKDAHAWFAQLKSTEKRMISMQDNKWSEIVEKDIWACRLCQQTRRPGDLPQHAFEPSELGRRQALQHLHKLHKPAYGAFLRCTPTVELSGGGPRSTETHLGLTEHWATATATATTASAATSGTPTASPSVTDTTLPSSEPTEPRRTTEAQRSRLRRLRATPEARQAEAERSKRRREQLTPAQRQADAERRARKRQRDAERVRSRTRRENSSPQTREREMQRSRERRRNATEQQRRREAQRSRERRENATEEQRLRERERCRRRYEAKKRMQEGTSLAAGSGSACGSTSGASTPPPAAPTRLEDVQRRSQQLEQQRAGLGLQLQLQSLYASLAAPAEAEARAAKASEETRK